MKTNHFASSASFATFVFSTILLCVAVVSMIGCEAPPPAEPVAPVSPANFDQTISQDKLVLVKFGATWCPPCRDIDRELKGLQGQLPADVEVLKIDVDENPGLVKRYGVSGIPKLLLVRNGEVLAERVGYMSGTRIQNWIGEYR